jgi:cell division septation protein DedD
MAASRICRFAAIAAVLIALSGCEEGQNPFAALSSGGGGDGLAEARAGGTAPAGGGEERDVESPQVFSATDQGLWDGRPSLGGIWVAHPGATSPERVVIRNTATGRETMGALFRREREMPGPRIQVSSDAAAALGMVAGSPAELSVVALVRERAPAAPPAGEALPSGGIEATPLEASETAAAAVAAVAATPPRTPTAGDRPASRPSRPAEAPTPAPAAQAPTPAAPAPSAPAAAAPTPAPAPAAPAATQAPLAGGSFIQVGIFSQEPNAERTAEALRDAGIVPAVRQQESNGRTVWRVLVGPVTTPSDRAALLERVRDLGFADAYVIRN